MTYATNTINAIHTAGLYVLWQTRAHVDNYVSAHFEDARHPFRLFVSGQKDGQRKLNVKFFSMSNRLDIPSTVRPFRQVCLVALVLLLVYTEVQSI